MAHRAGTPMMRGWIVLAPQRAQDSAREFCQRFLHPKARENDERENLESFEKSMNRFSNMGNARGHETEEVEKKAISGGSPLSPLAVPREGWHQLFAAAKSGLKGLSIQLDNNGLASQIGVKSPITESGLGGPPYLPTPTGLPPVMAPQYTQGLLCELDRLSSHLINATMESPEKLLEPTDEDA